MRTHLSDPSGFLIAPRLARRLQGLLTVVLLGGILLTGAITAEASTTPGVTHTSPTPAIVGPKQCCIRVFLPPA